MKKNTSASWQSCSCLSNLKALQIPPFLSVHEQSRPQSKRLSVRLLEIKAKDQLVAEMFVVLMKRVPCSQNMKGKITARKCTFNFILYEQTLLQDNTKDTNCSFSLVWLSLQLQLGRIKLYTVHNNNFLMKFHMN